MENREPTLDMGFITSMTRESVDTMRILLNDPAFTPFISDYDRKTLISAMDKVQESVSTLNASTGIDGILDPESDGVMMAVMQLYSGVATVANAATRIREKRSRSEYTTRIRSSYRRKRSD